MATVEDRVASPGAAGIRASQPRSGMVVPRVFSTEGVSPYDQVEWDLRTAAIKDEKGRVLFEQTNCEVPRAWSQLATNVVVSKYFYGEVNTPERESSVRDLVDRVTRTISDWGLEDGYFASAEDASRFYDELTALCLNQYGSFNSPVWFNVGLYHRRGINGLANGWRWDEETRAVVKAEGAYQYPQASACFIQSVADDMQDIMRLATSEAMLFKFGSGTGTDLSTLRSSKEKLAGGGKPSGPVSFMRVYDAIASVIKSGGKCLAPNQGVYTPSGVRTVQELAESGRDFVVLSYSKRLGRVSAKAAQAFRSGRKEVVALFTDKGEFHLSADHPMMLKTGEMVPIHGLRTGMSLMATSTYQHSAGYVRVGLANGRRGEPGRDLLHRLVAADVMGQDLADLSVHHRDGNRLDSRPENLEVMSQGEHAGSHGSEAAARGEHIFQTDRFPHDGASNGMHASSSFWLDRGRSDAYRARQAAGLVERGAAADMQKAARRVRMLNTGYTLINAGHDISTFDGYVAARKAAGRRCPSVPGQLKKFEREFGSYSEFYRELREGNHQVLGVKSLGVMDVYDIEVFDDEPDDKRPWSEHNFAISPIGQASLYGTHVFVANTRRAAKMQTLKIWHPDVLEFIETKTKEEKKARTLIEGGYEANFNGEAYSSVLFQNANLSVRVTDGFLRAVEDGGDWTTRAVTTGRPMDTYPARKLMDAIAEGTWLCGDPGLQYEDTIQRWHTCPNTAPINSSNPCCITGDTLIGVADGRNAVPIRDLVDQVVDVYAWDHGASKTVIAPMYNIGVKRRDARIFRVTLDDGSSFRATDDHLIMLRDGSYRQVKDLRSGDSLNPFHSRIREPKGTRTRRRFVYTGKGWRVQYRWVWESRHGAQPEGFHIHHRDFNSLNDRLDNLRLLPESDHIALHREPMLGDGNPARRCMTDEWRANISAATQGENNPNFGKTHPTEVREKMKAASALRWDHEDQRARASAGARRWMDEAREEGRRIGRKPGERFERSCPACRENFTTAREGQIFCSQDCRYSPLGRSMIGEKGGETRRGRALAPAHRQKLRASSVVAARPEDKRRAAEASLRSRCLKAARLLLDAGHDLHLDSWDESRDMARSLGAAHVPSRSSLDRFFTSDDDLHEHASLYNHKVASVEFDGVEDVYDGTVNDHHNFAIVTSQATSVAGPDHPDYSGCFIHNSEYMFIDDSACNLASLNLMKFRREDGTFDAPSFRAACRVFITAQEILVDHASYPTDRICQNSHKFRPLGLGYANLGSLIMADGLPYDSNPGRGLAACITAIMHGQAYLTSAEHAGRLGPFEGFPLNREPMLRVMEMHRDAVEGIDPSAPAGLLAEAREVWDACVDLGRRNGYRNSQVTVLAPTGTIAFMMDCDTTGIEPDIALVKYKQLAGGGMLKIVNRTVPMALRELGYDEPAVRGVLDYIDAKDTIEGAPGLHEGHLPVFDCAFAPPQGGRSIHFRGHLRMMSAVQPFLSGAISKTCNVPGDATVDDIREAYLEGWKLGLKAMAIYRDGSKGSQPVSTKSEADTKADAEAARLAVRAPAIPEPAPVVPPTPPVVAPAPILPAAIASGNQPRRARLPHTRQSLTHKFDIQGHEGYVTVGFYPDGRPGEVFITMAKEGSTIGGLMDVLGTSISMGLQYGVPLDVFVNKFAHSRFEPAGFTKNPDIPIAKSVTDYIFRWLGMEFIPGYREANAPQRPADDHAEEPRATVKVNGHRTATIADLEHTEAVLSQGPAAPAIPLTVDGLEKRDEQFAHFQSDAPACDNCGALTVRCGTCYRCFNCGNSMGCS